MMSKAEANVLVKWYDVDGQYITDSVIRHNVGRNVLESAFPIKAFTLASVSKFIIALRVKRAKGQ